MFGSMTDISDKNVREARIFAVLNREEDFGAIDALIYAYKPEPRDTLLAHAALVIDSSAFLRLGPQSDVIDYLELDTERLSYCRDSLSRSFGITVLMLQTQ